MFDHDEEIAELDEASEKLRNAIRRFDERAPSDLIELLDCATNIINSLADLLIKPKENVE